MRAKMSFEDKRKELLSTAKENSQEQGIVQSVSFDSEKVSEFLQKYKDYQQKAKQVSIIAK